MGLSSETHPALARQDCVETLTCCPKMNKALAGHSQTNLSPPNPGQAQTFHQQLNVYAGPPHTAHNEYLSAGNPLQIGPLALACSASQHLCANVLKLYLPSNDPMWPTCCAKPHRGGLTRLDLHKCVDNRARSERLPRKIEHSHGSARLCRNAAWPHSCVSRRQFRPNRADSFANAHIVAAVLAGFTCRVGRQGWEPGEKPTALQCAFEPAWVHWQVP